MAQDETTLLQARISGSLMARFVHQRERWGMSNTEMLERILTKALPEWEKAVGPPVKALK